MYFGSVEIQVDVIWEFIDAKGDDGHGSVDFIDIFSSNSSKDKNGFFVVIYLEEMVEVDIGFIVVVFGEMAQGEVILGLEEIWVFLYGELEQFKGLGCFILFVQFTCLFIVVEF